jgi:hypothetical protein
MKTRNCRSNGEGLVVLIILLAIIGGGVLWLYSHKKQLDRDARAFGRDMIQQLTVNHDTTMFVDHLSPQMKLNYPPSQLQYFQNKLKEIGVPQQPLKIDEQVTFESHFFEPHGIFQAQLMYPTGLGNIQMAISHPVSKWQIDDLTITYPH